MGKQIEIVQETDDTLTITVDGVKYSGCYPVDVDYGSADFSEIKEGTLTIKIEFTSREL